LAGASTSQLAASIAIDQFGLKGASAASSG
jgi:hypothetical protein